MTSYLDRLIADPTSFHDAPYAQAFTLSREEIDSKRAFRHTWSAAA